MKSVSKICVLSEKESLHNLEQRGERIDIFILWWTVHLTVRLSFYVHSVCFILSLLVCYWKTACQTLKGDWYSQYRIYSTWRFRYNTMTFLDLFKSVYYIICHLNRPPKVFITALSQLDISSHNSRQTVSSCPFLQGSSSPSVRQSQEGEMPSLSIGVYIFIFPWMYLN